MNKDDLAEKVFMALGQASTCWEHMNETGIFDSQRAEKVGNELIEWILSNHNKESIKRPVRPTPNPPQKIRGSF